MSYSYPIFLRHMLHGLLERFHSIDLRHSLTTFCLFFLLSLLTSTIVNLLIPILFLKLSLPPSSPPATSSSSLSLLSSKHVFFPSDITSLQCSSGKNHELQTHDSQQALSPSERKYTKDPLKRKNISSGKDILSSWFFLIVLSF